MWPFKRENKQSFEDMTVNQQQEALKNRKSSSFFWGIFASIITGLNLGFALVTAISVGVALTTGAGAAVIAPLAIVGGINTVGAIASGSAVKSLTKEYNEASEKINEYNKKQSEEVMKDFVNDFNKSNNLEIQEKKVFNKGKLNSKKEELTL